MGATASISVTMDEINNLPQYHLLGGDQKFDELKEDDGKLLLSKVIDPYLKYGGKYSNDIKNTKDFKYITYDSLPKLNDHTSIASKYLNINIFNELKDKVTSNQYTFSNVILSGVVSPNLSIGVTAGDYESYTIFKSLYDPIIKEIHGYDVNTSVHPNPSSTNDLTKINYSIDILNNLKDYIISTTIKSYRNLNNHLLLPGIINDNQRKDILDIFKSTFNHDSNLFGLFYDLSNQLDDETIHPFIIKPDINSSIISSGSSRDWPNNRGLFYNKSNNQLIYINHEDHLNYSITNNSLDILSLYQIYNNFNIQSSKLLKSKHSIDYLYSLSLGHITTCPSNLGTGMRVIILLNLKSFHSLTSDISNLLHKICLLYHLNFKHVIDSQFELSNKTTLGITEIQIIKNLIDGILNITKFDQLLANKISIVDIELELFPISNSPTSVTKSDDLTNQLSIKVNNNISNEIKVPTSPKASSNSQKISASNSPAPKPLSAGPINASKPMNTGKGYQSMKGGKIKIHIDELKFPGDEH